MTTDELPRWSVADVHASLDARSFVDELERAGADVNRLEALFDTHDVRAVEPRPPTEDDADAADETIAAFNAALERLRVLSGYTVATVSTDSRHERAQAVLSELAVLRSRLGPLRARLAEWLEALDVDRLAELSPEVGEHRGPLRRLALQAAHQMSEAEESLHAELTVTGAGAWARLHSDVTSQLNGRLVRPDGTIETLPMAAIRGLATHDDPAVRRAAYDAEMEAWPTVATTCAAAMNAIKGEANTVNRRRGWDSPLDTSLFANSVSRRTFDAMGAAVDASLDDFRRWMRTKAALHGHDPAQGLPWSDLVAPLPIEAPALTWDDSIAIVRNAFGAYSGELRSVLDRALDERWIDAPPSDGKRGGAFCMPFVGDRSLVLLNWTPSLDSTQTTAHELGHAYHNTTLAARTPLQRNVPMALAETASIFCETLVVSEALGRLEGDERLAMLDVDLVGANQVVVDIHSRFLFETEVFARRQRRTLGVSELNDLMTEAQADAYGDGLDQSTAHPHMWVLKPHYYGSTFYNWPYTYGLLFGLGLFARYHEDPNAFRSGYADVLSRAGMDTAEELGAAFGIDVTDEAFWTASLDVLRARMADYEALARPHLARRP